MATKSELNEQYRCKFIEIGKKLEPFYSIKEITAVAYGNRTASVAATYSDKLRGVRGVTRAEVMLMQFLWFYHVTHGDIRKITCEDGVTLNFN